MSHTVDPFLVCESLSLLSSVPFDNKSVTEGKRSARVGSSGVVCYRPLIKTIEGIRPDLQLIAIEQRPGKSGLNVSDGFILCDISTFPIQPEPSNQCHPPQTVPL